MKTTFPTFVAFFLLVLPATASLITIVGTPMEGFLGSTKSQVTTAHNGTTQVSYDATGVEKLVVTIGLESSFNNNKVNSVSVAFNSEPMMLAVQENTHDGTWDGGIAAIFYLDNPFQGAANFTVGATFTGGGANGGWVSIIGLSGTAPGIGNTGATWHTQTAAGPVDTSLTTTAPNSLVIAMVENSGRNNSAGLPTAVSPLSLIHNGNWGSQWGSGASGFEFVNDAGTTLTPTFNTNAGGNIHVVAVEFLAVPEPSSLVMLALGAGILIHRRRPFMK
jgi:hypothetical protein